MSELISAAEMSSFTGIMEEFDNTFIRRIVVFKEPVKTYTDNNSSNLYGYGEQSNLNNVQYTQVSGIFSGRIRHGQETQDSPPIRELNIHIPQGKAMIKVPEDCRNYILNGKTEIINVDNKNFNLTSDFGVQDYMGWKRYWFILKATP